MARFSAFSRGRIVGKAEEGAPRKKIRASVLKTDDTPSSLRAIDKVLAHARNDPDWDGTNSKAGGRPPELNPAELCTLKKFIHVEVGLAKVTMAYMRKRLPCLRRLPK